MDTGCLEEEEGKLMRRKEREEKSKRNRIFLTILLVGLSKGYQWYTHRNYHNSLFLSSIKHIL